MSRLIIWGDVWPFLPSVLYYSDSWGEHGMQESIVMIIAQKALRAWRAKQVLSSEKRHTKQMAGSGQMIKLYSTRAHLF